MSNKFNLTLDNKIYNCIISDEEDIEIILPFDEPKKQCYSNVNNKEKISIINYNKPTTIKMYINVIKEGLKPKLIIRKSNYNINIKFKTLISLISYGKSILTFSTKNNGLIWNVYQQYVDENGNIIQSQQNKKSVKILKLPDNKKEYITVFDLNGEAQKYSAVKENSQEIILEDRKNTKKLNNNFKIIKEGYKEKSKNTGESIEVFSDSIKMYTKNDTIVIAPTI